MWNQIGLNEALRAFLSGSTVKVVDFTAETVLSLEEVLQRFSEGVAFFTDGETITTPAQDLIFSGARGNVIIGSNGYVVTADTLTDEQIEHVNTIISPPATVDGSAAELKEDKATKRKKQLEKSEADYQKRKITDLGKLRALKEAGWSNAKIADEFGCTGQTVANTLKKLEVAT